MTTGVGPSDQTPNISGPTSSSPADSSSPSSEFQGQGLAMTTSSGFQNNLTQQFMENGKNSTPPITQAQAEQGAQTIVQSIMMSALQSLQQFANQAFQQQKQNEDNSGSS